ncbi:MAG: UDP-N-acetylmuramoyl-L-alanyl-D-glutamate--2,6-diaminopimelate ligase [bacterium]|nr:UDP-N-acetylmuramoyl-L-alanyl-D-glutamate--2,6-diaminopimelate ligase [bacterium]
MFYRFKILIKKISPKFLINWYHFGIAFLAALSNGFPGKKLRIIGVTGTNGKSTVVQMLSQIMEEAGFKVASLSSIRFRLDGKEEINTKRMTMPGRFFVQQFLAKAVKANCQYAVLEVTSEGIIQHRHRFINFGTAVFTNLTLEHIESHGSFEKYREAKMRLFRATRNIHIINTDDENAGYFLKFPSKQKFCYSLNNDLKIESLKIAEPNGVCKLKIENCKFIKATDINTSPNGVNFKVEDVVFSLHLLGDFNVYNALAAIAAARSQGIGLEICRQALGKINNLPGRMELVIKEPFKVFVDYAFTPNALEKVYQELTRRLTLDANKLVCVLGSCGGGRDKWKRPVLGKIAANYCDQIILTNEDPYDEDPQEIIDQINSGIESISVDQRLDQRQSATLKIIDRREAINKALSIARPGDTVIITGKGCEPSICLAGGKQIIWDDRRVVREEFSKINNKQ